MVEKMKDLQWQIFHAYDALQTRWGLSNSSLASEKENFCHDVGIFFNICFDIFFYTLYLFLAVLNRIQQFKGGGGIILLKIPGICYDRDTLSILCSHVIKSVHFFFLQMKNNDHSTV